MAAISVAKRCSMTLRRIFWVGVISQFVPTVGTYLAGALQSDRHTHTM